MHRGWTVLLLRAWALSVVLVGCGDASLVTPAVPSPVVPTGTVPGAPVGSPADGGVPLPVTPPGTDGPLVYGRAELATALANANSTAAVDVITAQDPAAVPLLAQGTAAPGTVVQGTVALDPQPGSFVVVPSGDRTVIIGRDAGGAMYGALDLAERVRMHGATVLPLAQAYGNAPAVPIRAANLFLVLPAAGETSWWFRDAGFWQAYLDLLAHARMNVLDLHGMYNLDNTIFPNALLYFGSSHSHPEVGAPAADREANVRMLDTVVGMARARGIRVALMTYRSDTSLTGDNTPPMVNEAGLRTYTLEAAEDLARRVPGLWRLGFRIAESGHAAAWYQDTLIAGVRAAGTGVGVYTRTWGATRPDILGVVQAAQGTSTGTPANNDPVVVEAKYNGEQLGAPYVIAGGAFVQQDWVGYSYQDYLQPRAPYAFVFQVRAGGTHRIFRHASFERARRTVASFTLGGAAGFTLEGAHVYFPQRDYYHSDADRYSPWTFRRDEIQYILYGRLAYDPQTPEAVFRGLFANRVGTDGLWDAVQAASDIVPWIQTANTCGPDHRSYAPELEWGGPVAYWATTSRTPAWPRTCDGPYHGPFDSFAVASAYDTAHDLIDGRATTRLSPLAVARRVLDDVARARAAGSVPIADNNPEARDVQRECLALADLGTYFAHKLRAATALAVYQGTADEGYLTVARTETATADAAWQALAQDTQYIAPFHDNLRMQLFGEGLFHWRTEARQLANDLPSLDRVQRQVIASPPAYQGTLPTAMDWLDGPRPAGPGLAALTATPALTPTAGWNISVTFDHPVPKGTLVRVLSKTFSGLTDWQSGPPMEPAAGTGTGTGAGADTTFTGFVRGEPDQGLFYAVEVDGGLGGGWRYPDVLTETPYRTVAPVAVASTGSSWNSPSGGVFRRTPGH